MSSAHAARGVPVELVSKLWAAAQLAAADQGPRCLQATVRNADHPTMPGRVQCECSVGDQIATFWLSKLMSISVREGDRVLVMVPGPEQPPVVIGVVDGFSERPNAERQPVATLRLQPEQRVTVCGAQGAILFEAFEGPDGPVIQLPARDATVGVEGELSFEADAIRLVARRGSVAMEASDDVVLRGETIRLN